MRIDFQIFAILSNPTDITADSPDNVYFLDKDKIQKFTTNSTFVKEWNFQEQRMSE